jgi:2'-hydroxyisoflavone reductase
VLVIRLGLIVGPHDPTDRFTYWPHRVGRGGEVLAPGNPARRVQVIDARDLVEWIIRMIEVKRIGVFNATGPAEALTMQQTFEECQGVSQCDAHSTWIDELFLLVAGIGAWIEMPLWVPEKENAPGMMQIDCAKALAAGLTFRALSSTFRDTLAWDATRPPSIEWRAGMKPERETDLLNAWHARD